MIYILETSAFPWLYTAANTYFILKALTLSNSAFSETEYESHYDRIEEWFLSFGYNIAYENNYIISYPTLICRRSLLDIADLRIAKYTIKRGCLNMDVSLF